MEPTGEPDDPSPRGRNGVGAAAAVTILGTLGGWLLVGGLRARSGADAATFGLPAGASTLVGVTLLAVAAATAARAEPAGGAGLIPLWLVAGLVALPAAVLVALHLLG